MQDVERGVMTAINPRPWQTDTSNGDWFYSDGFKYKTGADVIRMLADIVSKNGNLLLNVVLYPDGSLPPESQALLADLKAWMAVNAEAIHGTRPWTVFGEGPTRTAGVELRKRRLIHACGADSSSALPATGRSAHQPGKARWTLRTAAAMTISVAPASARRLLAASL